MFAANQKRLDHARPQNDDGSTIRSLENVRSLFTVAAKETTITSKPNKIVRICVVQKVNKCYTLNIFGLYDIA